MRLWSLHPKYLDSRGLVALWRESLLAQAVLRDETIGYRNHPQLERFRNHPAPLAVTTGQMAHEWAHLMRKLQARSPAHYLKWRATSEPEAHPLFRVLPGPTESWER